MVWRWWRAAAAAQRPARPDTATRAPPCTAWSGTTSSWCAGRSRFARPPASPEAGRARPPPCRRSRLRATESVLACASCCGRRRRPGTSPRATGRAARVSGRRASCRRPWRRPPPSSRPRHACVPCHARCQCFPAAVAFAHMGRMPPLPPRWCPQVSKLTGLKHKRGSVSMLVHDDGAVNSQFFIACMGMSSEVDKTNGARPATCLLLGGLCAVAQWRGPRSRCTGQVSWTACGRCACVCARSGVWHGAVGHGGGGRREPAARGHAPPAAAASHHFGLRRAGRGGQPELTGIDVLPPRTRQTCR